jgi:hypothetical protein
MTEGFEILKAFTITTPLSGKNIGRPFAMTATGASLVLLEAPVESVAHSRENLDAIYHLIPSE